MSITKQITLDRANRRKDKSVSITFITDLEQNSKEFMQIDELIGRSGILYFKEGDLTTEEIKAIDSYKLEEKEGKSQSQRTRNVLYRLWQQEIRKGNTSDDFNTFYDNKTEWFIDKIKSKLD